MAKTTEELHRWIATLDNNELREVVIFIDGLTLGRETALATAADPGATKKQRKSSTCSKCGQRGHRAPTCLRDNGPEAQA